MLTRERADLRQNHGCDDFIHVPCWEALMQPPKWEWDGEPNKNRQRNNLKAGQSDSYPTKA
jgi:hypothetical protein